MQKILIHIIIALFLTACSVYRADVEQGNLINAEQLDKLRVGMDKAAVQALLGTPLVKDAFDTDQWEYYYSLRQDGKVVKKSLLTLSFVNGRLKSFDGQASSK